MEDSLLFISLIFVLTTVMCVAIFYIAMQKDKKALYIILIWLILQAIFRLSGVYSHTSSYLKLILLILPPNIFIIYLFFSRKGKLFIDNLDAKLLTLIHIYRIPLQIVFYTLFLNDTLPELVRPIDRNIELLLGLTAPLIYYFGYIKRFIGKNIILTWNILGLILLFIVITNTNLSKPFPFQKFIIDPENWMSYFYFPIVWVPSFIVPLFIFSHLTAIRQIIVKKELF